MLPTVCELSGSLHSETSAPQSTEDINNYTKSYLVGLPRKKRGGAKDKQTENATEVFFGPYPCIKPNSSSWFVQTVYLQIQQHI